MIDRNHPAVEAASRNAYERAWGGEREPWSEVDDLERDEWRADQAHALSAALPHLTADDLRNTPAGRELMAEAWQEGAMAHAGSTSYMTPGARRVINEMMRAANPYRKETQ